jgi:hypothetical protein
MVEIDGSKCAKFLYFIAVLTLLVAIITVIVVLFVVLKPKVFGDFEYDEFRC